MTKQILRNCLLVTFIAAYFNSRNKVQRPKFIEHFKMWTMIKGIPRIVTPEKTGKSQNGFPRDVILSLIEV